MGPACSSEYLNLDHVMASVITNVFLLESNASCSLIAPNAAATAVSVLSTIFDVMLGYRVLFLDVLLSLFPEENL